MKYWFKASSWALMFLLSLMIGAYALSFFFIDAINQDLKIRFSSTPLSAWGHIIGGGLCLSIGALQFQSGIRKKYPQFHRLMGKIYLVCVLIGGIAGLLLAFSANGGPVAKLGFGMLAVLWLYSAAMAYVSIKKGAVEQHQEWMIRNFSLTFGAVMLRIHLPLLQAGFGLSFEEAYPVVAWLAWVPNLIVVEWLLIIPARNRLDQTQFGNTEIGQ
ncbi:MAG: putative membrane protein [Oceanicoccus sp.]|jgi:uncharacterized membrane protein